MSDIGGSNRIPALQPSGTPNTASQSTQSAATQQSQSVVASSGGSGAGATSTGNAGSPAVSIAASLAKLAEGGPFEGTFTGPNGVRLLGQAFVFQQATQYPTGANFTARLQADGAFIKAQLLTVNGQKLDQPQNLRLAVAAKANLIDKVMDQLAGNPNLRQATVLGSVGQRTLVNIDGQAFELNGHLGVQPGTQLIIKLTEGETAQVLGQNGQSIVPPKTVTLQAAGQQNLQGVLGRTVAGTVVSGGGGGLLASGTGLNLLVLDPEAAMTERLPGQGTILAGMVTGFDGEGRTLINTSVGQLAMKLDRPLGLGTRMGLEVLDLHPPPPDPARLGATDPGTRLDRAWSGLKDLATELRLLDPMAAQRMLGTLPQPDGRLAAAMLSMMQAISKGEARGILGDAGIDALSKPGRRGVARKLADDLDEMQDLAGDDRPESWSAFRLPLFDGVDLKQMAIYVRRRKPGPDDHDDPATGTRFIVDIDLKTTGPLQFDGLMRHQNLNLILRSERPLPDAWRLDINRLFRQTMGATGVEGVITFQAGVPRIAPLDDIRRAGRTERALRI